MTRSLLVAMVIGCAVCSLFFQHRYVDVEQIRLRPTSSSMSKSPTDANRWLSLDLNDGMDEMISRVEQIFIIMPAKAAGTSMKSFTNLCTNTEQRDNFLNVDEHRNDFLTHSLHLPPIVASHLYSDEPFIHLARHATPSTLVIQMYRDETDRLMSAIRHVITSRVCIGQTPMRDLKVEFNATHCIVEEESLLRLISAKKNEIGVGTLNILTCAAYDAIASNYFNLAVVSYKMADKLQKLIAMHHCPKLVDDPVRMNIATEKEIVPYIRLPDNGEHVDLDVWLNHKKNLLEWAFHLRQNASCQRKTKELADILRACPDNAIQLTSNLVAQL